MQCHYEGNGFSVISCNDNGPVIVISNEHSDLPYTSVKRWNTSEKYYICIDRPNCITQTHGREWICDAHVSVYRIDVRGKKWYLPHYINILDVLKSATLKVLCLTNANYKIDFLAFTRQIVTHYLKAAKIQKQLPPNVIYPRKRSWKGNAPVAINERKKVNTSLKNGVKRDARFVQTDQEHGVRYVRLDFVWSHALKPFIRTER